MPDSLFTLIAQIVNFLIIVLVLRFLLFDRLLSAIDSRRSGIDEKRREAEEERDRAAELRRDLREKRDSFRKEREKLMQSAREEASAEKKELIEKAREEAEDERRRRERQISREGEAFLQELREAAAEELVTLARRMVGDLAGESLEARIAERLLGDAEGGDSSLKGEFADAGSVAVVSSAELNEDVRERFRTVLPQPRFRIDESIRGIAVEGEGRRIAWTVDGWLDDFGRELQERIERQEEA